MCCVAFGWYQETTLLVAHRAIYRIVVWVFCGGGCSIDVVCVERAVGFTASTLTGLLASQKTGVNAG